METINNDLDSTRIEFKPRKNVLEILWLVFLMIYVGIPAYVAIFFDSTVFPCLLIFLFYMCIELFLLYGILWRLFGKEAIEVNNKDLILHYSFLFWHKEKVYQIDKMININIDAPHDPFPAIFQKVTGRFGLISFENFDGTEKSVPTEKNIDRKIIRFGYQINKSNAAVIVDKIKTCQNP